MTKNFLTKAFTRHSEKITSLSYAFATTILLTKNMIDGDFSENIINDFQAQMDVASTIPFYLASTFHYLAKKNPALIKIAGANVLTGAALLAAGGYRGNLLDPSFYLHAASMLPIAWAGFSLLCEKRTMAAVPELLSRPFHAAAGFDQGDIGQVIYSAIASLGELGLIATDKKLQKAPTPIPKQPK